MIAARLKRWLRPARPVLLPIWRAARSVAGAIESWGRDRLDDLDERRAARRRRGAPEPPIRPLRRRELVQLGREIPYYRGRQGYMGVAGRAASDLIHRRGLTTALELGPHLRPLIVGADVLVLRASPDLRSEGAVHVHDATKRPWPFPDKSYDLFVALQVFEHLGSSQAEVFREVRRVARHAILSLPIDWVMADPTNIHHRIPNERVLGWFAPVVPTRVLVGNPGFRKRLVYVFEDLPAPEDEPAR